jgi:hypothetical protein
MQTAAVASRFLIGDSSKAECADAEISVSYGGLIKHIVTSHIVQTVHSREAVYKFNNALIHFAERAYMLRDIDALEDVSSVLMNLPLDSARIVGLYYQALASQRKGRIDEAKTLFETVADNAPATYRARALQSLGTNHHTRYQLDEALRFQLEALRAASGENVNGVQTILLAHLETSHVKSDTSDHKGALAVLESISRLVQIVSRQSPLYFYFYHNELAVEFGQLNRIEEAKAASKVALACPFASAYPEWSETRQELEAKRTSATPSIVAVHRPPEADSSPEVEPHRRPEPSRALTFGCSTSDRDSFQRSIISIPARATYPFSAISILDRVLICIAPRAPPAPA